MFKLASAFSISQQPQISKMQPAQAPTPTSPSPSPSSARRKQPTSSQKQASLKQQKKQTPRPIPFSLTAQETVPPFHEKTLTQTTPTKKITILRRGDPVPDVSAAPSENVAEQGPNNQKGPKKSQRRRKDHAKNNLSSWSEPLTGDETSTSAPRMKTSRSEPNGFGLSDKANLAEFKRTNSAELPASRFEGPLPTDGRTKQQNEERNNRKDYGSSNPRATPRKNKRGERRKKDSAGAILDSELDAMHYMANQPLARVGESSDSDALASSPPVHNEHGLDFSLSSLVNAPSKSFSNARTTHNNNNHKAVMLKQNGGNKSIVLLSKSTRTNLQIAENNTNKSTTRRRNNGRSAQFHENSTKMLSTSVPESNSGLMRSPLTNVTSVTPMGSATHSKQQRRRELFPVTAMPGGAQAEPAHSGGAPFIRRRRSVSSVDDHTQDLPMSSPVRPKSQLYAGPTFHNSPAPSSLPVPAFMKINEQK